MSSDATKSIRPYASPVKPVQVVERQVAEGTDKTSENREIQKKSVDTPIFLNKSKHENTISRITIESKPVAEQSQAAVSSTKSDSSIFNNKEGRYVAVANLFAPNTATAGALQPTDQGSSSGDKKEGRNTFISASKKLTETRKEKVEEDDIGNQKIDFIG